MTNACHGEPVLGAVDLDQPGLCPGDLPDGCPGGLHRDERVAGSVDEQDRHGEFGQHLVRLEVEDLVEQRPAQPEGGGVGQEAVFGQFLAGAVAELVVMPVGLVVDEPLLVVQQRVEQHQPPHLSGVAGREKRGDPAAEAGADQVDRAAAGQLTDMPDPGADVVGDAGDGEVLLAAFALAVAAEVETQCR